MPRQFKPLRVVQNDPPFADRSRSPLQSPDERPIPTGISHSRNRNAPLHDPVADHQLRSVRTRLANAAGQRLAALSDGTTQLDQGYSGTESAGCHDGRCVPISRLLALDERVLPAVLLALRRHQSVQTFRTAEPAVVQPDRCVHQSVTFHRVPVDLHAGARVRDHRDPDPHLARSAASDRNAKLRQNFARHRRQKVHLDPRLSVVPGQRVDAVQAGEPRCQLLHQDLHVPDRVPAVLHRLPVAHSLRSGRGTLRQLLRRSRSFLRAQRRHDEAHQEAAVRSGVLLQRGVGQRNRRAPAVLLQPPDAAVQDDAAVAGGHPAEPDAGADD
uniref:(northern house mosquito) hypothetical protein n=1 Tax=Culex pipiens TaxID=7175 RepID=A0A8D8J751_CULPI